MVVVGRGGGVVLRDLLTSPCVCCFALSMGRVVFALSMGRVVFAL